MRILNVGGNTENILQKRKEVIDWHTGFYSATKIEFAEESEKLRIEREHLLSKQPVRIDLLIEKLGKDTVIHKNIGQIFRRYNIIEYKSPEDNLTVDDFYKVYAYVCLFISDTGKTGEIDPEEVTITFVCNHFPKKMLKNIQQTRKMQIIKREEGIYDLSGDAIPMQLLVTKQLTKEKNYWLQSLRSNIKDTAEIREILNRYQEHRNDSLYKSVMNVIVNANWKKIEEVEKMCEALERMFEPRLQEIAQKIKAEAKAEARQEVKEEVKEEARQEAKQRSIQLLIEIMQEFQASFEQTVSKIMDKFSLSREEAEYQVKIYWK